MPVAPQSAAPCPRKAFALRRLWVSKASAAGVAFLPTGILYEKGYLLEGGNRFDEAAAIYDDALAWLSTAPAGLETAKFKMRSGYCTGVVGDPAKGVALLTEALALAHELDAKECVWRALNNLGIVSFNARAFDQALYYYQQQRMVAEECGDLEGIGKALLNSANTRIQLKEYEGADEAYLRSIELFDGLGKRDTRLNAKLGQVNAHFFRSRYAQARRLCQEILEENRTVNSPILEGQTCLMLANIEFVEGRFAAAVVRGSRALEVGLRTGDRLLQISALNSNSVATLYRGDADGALAFCEQGLAVARSVHPLYTGITLVNKSNVLIFQERFEQATALAGESAEIAKEYGDGYTAANATGNLGTIDLELGRYHQAKALLDEALATFRSLGDERGMATIEGMLGNYHYNTGEYGAAREIYQRVAAAAERLRDPVMTATIENCLGRLSRETGDPAVAQRHFDRAIAGSREIGFQHLLADALHDSADLCFRLGRCDQARALNTEALAIADGMGRIEMQLRCGLLDARLKARCDAGAAVAQLKKLSQRHQRPENIADIAYEMFQITKSKDQRQRAAGLYAGLFAATPRIRYQTRRDELLQV